MSEHPRVCPDEGMTPVRGWAGRSGMLRVVGWLALALALGGAWTPGMAAEAAAPLALRQVIAQALAQRPDIQAAEAAVRQAVARQGQARAGLRPHLDVVAELLDTRRWDSYTGVQASYEVPGVGRREVLVSGATPRYQLLPRLELSYDIYAGGRVPAAMRQAERQAQAARFGVQVASQQVVLRVARRYLGLRSACLMQDSAAAALDVADATLRQHAGRRRRGQLADIEWQQARLAQLEQQQRYARETLQVRLAWVQLQAAIQPLPGSLPEGEDGAVVSAGAADGVMPADAGLPDAVNVMPSGTAADQGRICHFAHDLADDMADALGMAVESPALAQQAQALTAAQARLEVDRAASRPRLSLFAQYGQVARRDHGWGALLGETRRQQALVGLRLHYPLYDGGMADASVAAAMAEIEGLQRQQQMSRDRLQAYRQVNGLRQQQARQALVLDRSRLALAQSRLHLAQSRLRAGRLAQLTLAQARLQQHEARNALGMAEIDLARLQLDLHFAEAAIQGAID